MKIEYNEKEIAAMAERVAAQTLKEMRAAMKINYFDDAALIAEQSEKYNGQ